LILYYATFLSSFAFDFNLRRYNTSKAPAPSFAVGQIEIGGGDKSMDPRVFVVLTPILALTKLVRRFVLGEGKDRFYSEDEKDPNY
jgi:hypothetical protein